MGVHVQGSQTTLAEIASRLEAELDSLATAAAQQIYDELPDYRVIARADLISSVRTNISRGVRSLSQRDIPAADEVAEPQHTTRRRMAQGMAIDAIIRAYRLNLTATHERFIQLATDSDLPTADTLLGSNLLWQLGDWFMDLAVREYRSSAVTEAVRRRVEKTEVLRALGDADADPELSVQRALALGLREDTSYRVIMSATGDRAKWVEIVEKKCGTATVPAIAADLGSMAVGVIADREHSGLEAYPVAAGPVVTVGELSHSWQLARLVLNATPMTSGSWNDIGSLGWRLAVPDSPEITALLDARYLQPLREQGEFGEVVLASVRAFITHGMSVKHTASALFIHENSLRHRLQRFAEITGRDPAQIDTLLEIEWLGHLLALSILSFE